MGHHRTPGERLAELEVRRRQLEDRIAAMSAREKNRQRKDDHRRRMILGSIVLTDLATNPNLAAYIRARLPAVMHQGDHRLFADILGSQAS